MQIFRNFCLLLNCFVFFIFKYRFGCRFVFLHFYAFHLIIYCSMNVFSLVVVCFCIKYFVFSVIISLINLSNYNLIISSLLSFTFSSALIATITFLNLCHLYFLTFFSVLFCYLIFFFLAIVCACYLAFCVLRLHVTYVWWCERVRIFSIRFEF